MSKRTPGPWRARHLYYSDHPDNACTEIVAAPKHDNHTATKIAEAAYSTVASEYHVSDQDEAEANARIIAAAPELLEALELLHNNFAEYQRINNMGGYDNHDMRMARAAIAKAKGETP